MNCQDASVSLQLALDGEITPKEQEGLDAHLSACLPCRRMEAWLDELQNSYLAVDPLDAGFADEVISALGHAMEPTSSPQPAETVSATTTKQTKKTWLRRLWKVARFGFRRKRPAEPKQARWTTTAAGSMAFGFKMIRPGLQPAVAGPSHATSWLRIAGSNLLTPGGR